MTVGEVRTYRGLISEREVGEAFDVLFLSGVDEPLAEELANDIDSFGRYLTVRYFISDSERSGRELHEALVRQIVGAGEAVFAHHYSEITGYLWTDEDLMVGGHDLLEELRSHKGSFVHLEVTFSREATEQ